MNPAAQQDIAEEAQSAGSTAAPAVPVLSYEPAGKPKSLLRELLVLAIPVLFEQMAHTVVGLTDTWLANNLPDKATAATAAVGNIAYVFWFIGLIVAAIGSGATALISRARGARHRSLANSVCGQSVTASVVLGLVLAAVMYVWADPLVRLLGLQADAHAFAVSYLRMMTVSVPFTTLMFTANACLRGAGDTKTPAIAMIVVDVVNVVFSFGLTFGWLGLPAMGFEGIALGTVIAYVCGGVISFVVLLSGRGGITLHAHRLRPHWNTMRRVLRIGVPAGAEGLLIWFANISVVKVINGMDQTSVASAAHMNAVRIEALSYLPGYAFAMAAATMVGHALGAKDPKRAAKSIWLAYAVGGGIMTLCGLFFVFAADWLCRLMLPTQPEVAALTAQCLRLAGFIQAGFAGAMILSGALRGAGDTMAVMVLNLSSIIGVRLVGVLIVVLVFKQGLFAVWCVLCGELVFRGFLNYVRFASGKWKHVKV
ncbi:MAG TPA: MATE family efflux transporter [Tepidisphaeraceae bacterium]|nr:MATE family efflux transporter [Tepidisphaeraceae bacterium]